MTFRVVAQFTKKINKLKQMKENQLVSYSKITRRKYITFDPENIVLQKYFSNNDIFFILIRRSTIVV